MKNIVISNYDAHTSESFSGCSFFDLDKNELIIDVNDAKGTARTRVSGEDVDFIKLHDGGEVAIKANRKCYLLRDGVVFVDLGKFCKMNGIEVGFY